MTGLSHHTSVHPCRPEGQKKCTLLGAEKQKAEKKGTSSVALHLPFWATWVDRSVMWQTSHIGVSMHFFLWQRWRKMSKSISIYLHKRYHVGSITQRWTRREKNSSRLCCHGNMWAVTWMSLWKCKILINVRNREQEWILHEAYTLEYFLFVRLVRNTCLPFQVRNMYFGK